MATSKKAEWFRQKFDGQFNSRELMKEEVKNFFEDLGELVTEDKAKTLPAAFFDLALNAKNYAGKKGITAQKARELIIERPEILLAMHNRNLAGAHAAAGFGKDISGAKPSGGSGRTMGTGRKAMPPEDVLYEGVLNFRKKNHDRNPRSNTLGHEGLPEGSMSWSNITRLLREQGSSLGQFIDRKDREAKERKTLTSGTLPTLQGDDILQSCEESIKRERSLPRYVQGHSAVVVNACLFHERVEGLGKLFPQAAKPPKNLADFAVAAGLAKREGSRIIFNAPEHRF